VKRIFGIVEGVTTIAVLVMCILAGTALLRSGTLNKQRSPNSDVDLRGRKMDVPGLSGKYDYALVFAVSARCKYCTASVPAFKNIIAARTAARPNFKIVALFPESEDGKQYLSEKNLNVDTIASASFGSLHIRGTPTTLLLKSDNTVAEAWPGAISEKRSKDVLETIRKYCDSCVKSGS
jgi:thioredoxin-related protein